MQMQMADPALFCGRRNKKNNTANKDTSKAPIEIIPNSKSINPSCMRLDPLKIKQCQQPQEYVTKNKQQQPGSTIANNTKIPSHFDGAPASCWHRRPQ
jgi:hypothetical protein